MTLENEQFLVEHTRLSRRWFLQAGSRGDGGISGSGRRSAGQRCSARRNRQDEYAFRCRTIDDNGAAQPMPRPFRKSDRAAIEEMTIEVEP